MVESTFFNKNLHEWIILVHNNINKINNWRYKEPKINTYGYDNYKSVLTNILTNLQDNQDDLFVYIANSLNIDNYINISHDGWRHNYIQYANNPIASKNPNNPKKPIITNSRNLLAISNGENLDKIEKEKYIDIINSVFGILTNILINEGMKSLSIG